MACVERSTGWLRCVLRTPLRWNEHSPVPLHHCYKIRIIADAVKSRVEFDPGNRNCAGRCEQRFQARDAINRHAGHCVGTRMLIPVVKFFNDVYRPRIHGFADSGPDCLGTVSAQCEKSRFSLVQSVVITQLLAQGLQAEKAGACR